MTGPRRVLLRLWRVVAFAGYYTYEFIYSNVQVLEEVLRPRQRAAPAVVTLPLRCRTPVEIAFLANAINLTPGTLTLEIMVDPPTLYVHGMFAPDPDAFLQQLRRTEKRLLAALRPVGEEP